MHISVLSACMYEYASNTMPEEVREGIRSPGNGITEGF